MAERRLAVWSFIKFKRDDAKDVSPKQQKPADGSSELPPSASAGKGAGEQLRGGGSSKSACEACGSGGSGALVLRAPPSSQWGGRPKYWGDSRR